MITMQRACLLVCFILVGALVACDVESIRLEHRRKATIELIDHGGGGVGDERVDQLVISALQQADSTSLRTPQLVDVEMRIIIDSPSKQKGHFRVSWVSAAPTADGIRVRFSDGVEQDIGFDDIELQYNEMLAKTMVAFGALPFVEREYPETWKRLLTDLDAVAVLINQDKLISNTIKIHRVSQEVSKPSP